MFNWFKKEKPVAPPPPVKKPNLYEDSIFSTHRARQMRDSKEFQARNIPRAPAFYDNIKGVGQDSDFVASLMDTAKNAFTINQQRIPDDLFSWYLTQSFIGYQACGIIAQQWLINKACTMKGRDAVRNGFELVVNDEEELSTEITARIVELDKAYKLDKNLVQASKFNNVFGIRHILFKVESDDPDYYSKPFNPDGITPGSYKGMVQIDPYWITPFTAEGHVKDSEITFLGSAFDSFVDPTSSDFYDPPYWTVYGKRYHKSHFVILRGDEVVDILKPSYIYGGLPLTQRIYERVYAAERTANEGPELALTKRLNVRKLDLAKALANETEFRRSTEWMVENRNNYGVWAVGKDEEVEQFDVSLTDLDEVIQSQYQLVASESNIPATKLLGVSPKGFQSTGEHEIATYHEELESIQENDLTPIVNRHHLCIMRSEIAPEFGIEPLDLEIEWAPLDVPTGKEQAEINNLKSQTDANLFNTGALDAYDIRDNLIRDKNSGYSEIETVDRPEELTDLEPDLEELSQEFNNGQQNNSQTKAQDSTAKDVIRRDDAGWYIFSQKGDRLDGPFKMKSQAKNRLRQIEYFKNKEKKDE